MIIPSDCNPAGVCSDDETRMKFHNVKVEGGFMIATCGRRLVVQEVEIEECDQRSELTISKHLINRAIAANTFFDEEGEAYHQNSTRIMVEKDSVETALPDGVGLIDRTNDDFPKWEKVIPQNVGPIKLTINVRLLMGLAEALGDEVITLHLDPEKPEDAMFVFRHNHPDRFGIIKGVKYLTPTIANENTALAYAREQQGKEGQ